MKQFDICGMGNAIVDIFVEVTDEELAATGFERGTMRLVDSAEQHMLLEILHARDPRLVSGGSVANSVIAQSQLGGKGAFIGCVGDDRYGLHYQEEFSQLGIDMGTSVVFDQTTGTCACLITPDAERTMRTCLAVSSHLSEMHIDPALIKASKWLFIEGYVFANPETGQGAICEAIRVARENGVSIALTCSDAFVPEVFSDAFRSALAQADLLFCNAVEACSVAKAATAADAFTKLQILVPSVVVTDGPKGAYLRHEGIEAHVAAFPCEPRDLTGAGDMFAGAFLYGITHGIASVKAARAANFLAMKVISQVGARLHHGTKTFWEEALAVS